jgi:hypothetical protein
VNHGILPLAHEHSLLLMKRNAGNRLSAGNLKNFMEYLGLKIGAMKLKFLFLVLSICLFPKLHLKDLCC